MVQNSKIYSKFYVFLVTHFFCLDHTVIIIKLNKIVFHVKKKAAFNGYFIKRVVTWREQCKVCMVNMCIGEISMGCAMNGLTPE